MAATLHQAREASRGRAIAERQRGRAEAAVRLAENKQAEALAAIWPYVGFSYDSAATQARRAYDRVMTAAAKINVMAEPEASQAGCTANGNAGKFLNVFDNTSRHLARKKELTKRELDYEVLDQYPVAASPVIHRTGPVRLLRAAS